MAAKVGLCGLLCSVEPWPLRVSWKLLLLRATKIRQWTLMMITNKNKCVKVELPIWNCYVAIIYMQLAWCNGPLSLLHTFFFLLLLSLYHLISLLVCIYWLREACESEWSEGWGVTVHERGNWDWIKYLNFLEYECYYTCFIIY